MFGRMFSSKSKLSKTAQMCVDLIVQARIEAGYKGGDVVIPIKYASNYAFVGSLIGLVDYMIWHFEDSTSPALAVQEVITKIFGDNASVAMVTVNGGGDNDDLLDAMSSTQEYLENVPTRSATETAKYLLFMKRFF